MATYTSNKQLQEAIIAELNDVWECSYPINNLETISTSKYKTNIYFVASGQIKRLKINSSLYYIDKSDVKQLVREMYSIISNDL
jgi:hypothetical protein